VVAHAGESTGPALEVALINHVKAALGSVPAPKSVLFADELPLNSAGKVDKKAIRKSHWQGRARQIG
jgi:acyl-CoA synthetase (AMP-forming)/AMP-acid ligase II